MNMAIAKKIRKIKIVQGQSIPTEIFVFLDYFNLGMLCPKLATQGQLIGECEKGLAFAF